MATWCRRCARCRLEHEAQQCGEDVDSLMRWVVQRLEQHGENDPHVLAGWKLIDQMDKQMQDAHQRAKALAHEHLKEHAGVHAHEWLQGA